VWSVGGGSSIKSSLTPEGSGVANGDFVSPTLLREIKSKVLSPPLGEIVSHPQPIGNLDNGGKYSAVAVAQTEMR
jgi:hypothetical protein